MKLPLYFFSLLWIINCDALAQSFTDKTDSVRAIESFSNLYQYQDFYLGGQPSLGMLEWLEQQGVVTIINLRSEGENNDFTATAFNEERMAGDMGFNYQSLPVNGIGDYSPEKLEAMAGLIKPGEKVLIHCAGAGRVTHFFMAYLVKYRDYSLDDAVEIGKQLKFSLPLENLLDEKISLKILDDTLPQK